MRSPAPPAKKKVRSEKPKFDVTCIQCGTAAHVPFRPIEGRDVFCQPCYQARRGLVAPAAAPVASTSSAELDHTDLGEHAGHVEPSVHEEHTEQGEQAEPVVPDEHEEHADPVAHEEHAD